MSLEDLYYSEGNGSGVRVELEQKGRWEGETWERGVSGNCNRNVIYDKIKNLKIKIKKQPIAMCTAVGGRGRL